MAANLADAHKFALGLIAQAAASQPVKPLRTEKLEDGVVNARLSWDEAHDLLGAITASLQARYPRADFEEIEVYTKCLGSAYERVLKRAYER